MISPDGVLEVLGKGTVTVVDGSRAQSDAFEVRARRPVLVSGVVLHALPPGYRFDLGARVLLPRLQAIATPGGQARQEVARVGRREPRRRQRRRRRGAGGIAVTGVRRRRPCDERGPGGGRAPAGGLATAGAAGAHAPGRTSRSWSPASTAGPTTGPTTRPSTCWSTWGRWRTSPPTCSVGSPTTCSSSSRAWSTTPAGSAARAGSWSGCARAPGWATWPSTSPSSSSGRPGASSGGARPAAPARAASTT